jgi:hypothetical protein
MILVIPRGQIVVGLMVTTDGVSEPCPCVLVPDQPEQHGTLMITPESVSESRTA